jgi:hypothetical protein
MRAAERPALSNGNNHKWRAQWCAWRVRLSPRFRYHRCTNGCSVLHAYQTPVLFHTTPHQFWPSECVYDSYWLVLVQYSTGSCSNRFGWCVLSTPQAPCVESSRKRHAPVLHEEPVRAAGVERRSAVLDAPVREDPQHVLHSNAKTSMPWYFSYAGAREKAQFKMCVCARIPKLRVVHALWLLTCKARARDF